MIDFHHRPWRGRHHPDLPLPHWFWEHGDLDHWFARFPDRAKMGLHRNAVLVPGDGGARVFCKRYRVRTYERLLGLTGRAKRAHQRILTLQQLGLQTPDTLGYVQGPHFDYLFQQAPTGAADLRRLKADGTDIHSRAEQIYRQVTGQLALLHRCGRHHGDCKWENILLNPETGRLLLIDFDGNRRLWPFNRQRFFAKDLARFILSSQENGMADSCEQQILALYSQQLGTELSAGFLRRIRRLHAKIQRRHNSDR